MELDFSKTVKYVKESDYEEETIQDSRTIKKKVFFLILSVLVLSLIFLFMYSLTQKDPFADLKGTVYLTLALRDDNMTDLYELDIISRNISRIFDDNFVKYTSKVSPNGEMIAYIASPLNRESGFSFPFSEFLQVYIQDINSNIIKKLTDSNTISKRLPTWSPDGQRIAFTAQYPDASEEDFFIPNKWGVGVVDIDGNMERIDFGTSPFWSPDGSKLLFLKNDGLYIYTFDKKTSTQVWKVIGGEASTNMKLDISNDGSLLVWSVANRRELTLFEIISWDPFQLKIIQRIDTANNMAFWPVFSPDNHYIISQEIEINTKDGELINPVLVVYNLETLDRIELIDLDEYNFDMTFITDWR